MGQERKKSDKPHRKRAEEILPSYITHSRIPQRIQCAHCHNKVKTMVTGRPSMCSYICCLVLCFSFLAPCGAAALCCDCIAVWEHQCPNCGAKCGQKNCPRPFERPSCDCCESCCGSKPCITFTK